MNHPRCKTCRFWDSSTRCAINPPVADDRTSLAVWPYTDASDWCAKHERDPEAKDGDDQ